MAIANQRGKSSFVFLINKYDDKNLSAGSISEE